MTARCILYMSASHVSSQRRTRVKLNRVFTTLPVVSPKFPHVPLRVGGGLWATKSEGVGLSVRAISCQDFQSQYRALHYSASRGKKKLNEQINHTAN